MVGIEIVNKMVMSIITKKTVEMNNVTADDNEQGDNNSQSNGTSTVVCKMRAMTQEKVRATAIVMTKVIPMAMALAIGMAVAIAIFMAMTTVTTAFPSV